MFAATQRLVHERVTGRLPDTPAEQAMENGPSTIRPDTSADELALRLRARDLKTAIISSREGELIGIASRADLEQH